jgi:hypothetical protein
MEESEVSYLQVSGDLLGASLQILAVGMSVSKGHSDPLRCLPNDGRAGHQSWGFDPGSGAHSAVCKGLAVRTNDHSRGIRSGRSP